jgi:hypothetical protein
LAVVVVKACKAYGFAVYIDQYLGHETGMFLGYDRFEELDCLVIVMGEDGQFECIHGE